jgi:LPXTG-motif cell wall-anchored protein
MSLALMSDQMTLREGWNGLWDGTEGKREGKRGSVLVAVQTLCLSIFFHSYRVISSPSMSTIGLATMILAGMAGIGWRRRRKKKRDEG